MKAVYLDSETGDTWTDDVTRPPEPGEMVSSRLPGKYRPYQVLDNRDGEGELRVNVSELKPLPRVT